MSRRRDSLVTFFLPLILRCLLFRIEFLGNRHPPPATHATWGVDSGYPDSGHPTLATYKADTGYPTLATPTLATYKG